MTDHAIGGLLSEKFREVGNSYAQLLKQMLCGFWSLMMRKGMDLLSQEDGKVGGVTNCPVIRASFNYGDRL